MENLKNLLGITKEDEFFTKKIQKPKSYNHVKDNTLLVDNKNFMSDLLFLPETKKKYKYLFVITDLASNDFDFEPLKSKEPNELLKAVKTISKRKYIQLEKNDGQSLRTDSGKEFRGDFSDYLYKNSILHRIGHPNRHIQQANIERLNGTLGTLLNGYMASKEKVKGDYYKEWTEILPVIREELNKIRRVKLPDNIYTYNYPVWNAEKEIKNDITTTTDSKQEKVYEDIPPKYKVGDLVHVVLETPEDNLGAKQKGNFRNGDVRLTKEPHKIIKILYYHGPPYYRYLVNGFKGVSYQESELKPARENAVELFKVKAILDRKSINRKMHYKIWYSHELKKDASYQPKTELVKDIPDEIKKYDEMYKDNKKAVLKLM